MRKLAIGAAITGALALTGPAVPLAQAAAAVKVPVTYTLTRPADVAIDGRSMFAGITLYRGRLAGMDNDIEATLAPTCTTTATTATTVTESCSDTITVDPEESLYETADATTWNVAGFYARSTYDLDDSDDKISASQPAKLQFRAKSSSTYTTVETVTTGTGGALTTTVKPRRTVTSATSSPVPPPQVTSLLPRGRSLLTPPSPRAYVPPTQ